MRGRGPCGSQLSFALFPVNSDPRNASRAELGAWSEAGSPDGERAASSRSVQLVRGSEVPVSGRSKLPAGTPRLLTSVC